MCYDEICEQVYGDLLSLIQSFPKSSTFLTVAKGKDRRVERTNLKDFFTN